MRFSQHQISSDCDFEGKPPSGNDSISGQFDIVNFSSDGRRGAAYVQATTLDLCTLVTQALSNLGLVILLK
jgi:hypothetical protein